MSMTDPIAACLTSIRNAIKAKKPRVNVPASKVKAELCRILKEEGFIQKVEQTEQGRKPSLEITLKYTGSGRSVVNEIRRISKPGRRVYKGSAEIPHFKNGIGVLVLSTSKGMLSDQRARKAKIGGEVICSIW